jgi:hypothetical protein
MAARLKFGARLASTAAIAALAWPQIPPSEPLAPADAKAFHAEVRRLEQMLQSAADKCTVKYALARTWASAGQYSEAMRALEEAVAPNAGLDPENDPMFARLRPTSEFRRLMQEVHDATPPITNSRLAFTVDEPDLFPEGIAYDPRKQRFFLGSTSKRKVIECSYRGECREFVAPGRDGLGEVLGLKTNPQDGTLWATSNSDDESSVFHFSASGKLIRKYVVSREPGRHMFNDLAIDERGDVYVTDSLAGAVYWISRKTHRLEVLNPALKMTAANGIALAEEPSPKLFVAGFPDGITIVDPASGSFHALKRPANLCLATIDGLYYAHGSLFAIQSGIMVPRVVRLRLSSDLESIESFEVLERRNPRFDGPTTAAIAGDALYVIANPQLDRKPEGQSPPVAQLKAVDILWIELSR